MCRPAMQPPAQEGATHSATHCTALHARTRRLLRHALQQLLVDLPTGRGWVAGCKRSPRMRHGPVCWPVLAARHGESCWWQRQGQARRQQTWLRALTASAAVYLQATPASRYSSARVRLGQGARVAWVRGTWGWRGCGCEADGGGEGVGARQMGVARVWVRGRWGWRGCGRGYVGHAGGMAGMAGESRALHTAART